MTVIVGVQSNEGEQAVVLVADKLSYDGREYLPDLVLSLQERSKLPLSGVL